MEYLQELQKDIHIVNGIFIYHRGYKEKMRSFIVAQRSLTVAIEEANFLGKSTEAMYEALEELLRIEKMSLAG